MKKIIIGKAIKQAKALNINGFIENMVNQNDVIYVGTKIRNAMIGQI